MGIILDRDKARASQVESYLNQWAECVRGNVDLGYPHITPEARHIFGGGMDRSEWPEAVEEVEIAVCCMPDQIRLATVRFYVYRRRIHSIAREMKCGHNKVSDLLGRSRAFVDAFMRVRMAA